MADIEKYSKALDEALKSDNLEKVNIGLGEVLADSLLIDGVIKDIPFIATFVGLTKTGVQIHDWLFLKKIISFLSGLNDIPAEKRIEMISKIDESKKYRINVGEKLLFILERCEDHEKAEITARLFRAFIEEKILYAEFLKATKTIENIIIEDLNEFVQNNFEELSIEESAEYLNWGLFEIKPVSLQVKQTRELEWGKGAEYKVEGGELKLKITEIGKKIREVLK